MAQKSRPFSIFLLKGGFSASNALPAKHSLSVAKKAANAPEGSTIYILDTEPKRPWWSDYFGVQEELWQESKGALIFLPVDDRCFALSFGHVFHHLNDDSYEYDFGLKVTLNSVDPKKLKSADMIEPGPARRKRTQVPVSTELTYLDFDGNSEIIKSLTGKVKNEYQDLFATATGSASLKISMCITPNELAKRCKVLLELYKKDDYKRIFPNIQNIVPIKEPAAVNELDGLLLNSMIQKDGSTTMSIPDIVDYRENTCCIFTGAGRVSDVYPDISIEAFYSYMGDKFKWSDFKIDHLKSYRVVLTDVEGTPGRSYGLYRTLIFDAKRPGEDAVYHLNDGIWYKAEKSFVERLRLYLDARCEATDLISYNHDEVKDDKSIYSEENYNTAISNWNEKFICLDQTDISPADSTQIEPCDIYCVNEDESSFCGYRAIFYHIKISTRSSNLSHLFNQGVNSVELIELELTSANKLKQIIIEKIGNNDESRYLSPFDKFDFKVVFGIITHKEPSLKSENLPLFSKISLMRCMQRLALMKIPSALTFIGDDSPTKSGYAKHSKFTVEVYDGAKGHVVRAVAGQGIDTNIAIKGCPKQIRESLPGTRFNVVLRIEEDGNIYSHHTWEFELVA